MEGSSCAACDAVSIPCGTPQCVMYESMSAATPGGISYANPISWLEANANSTAATNMGWLWVKAESSTNGKSSPPALRQNLGAAMIYEWTNRVQMGKPVDPAFALEYIQVREGEQSKTYRDYQTMIKEDVQVASSCAYELLATSSYQDFEKRVRAWKLKPKHPYGNSANKWYKAGPGNWSASTEGLYSNPQFGGLLTLPGSSSGPVTTPAKMTNSTGSLGLPVWQEWLIVGAVVLAAGYVFYKFEI